MTDVQNISAALKTKLQGISGLSVVYEHEIDKPDDGKYPFATITPTAFDGQFGDNRRNQRTYEFTVHVYQERTATGFGGGKAERLVREMTDEILTAFDMDTTLSGMVNFIRPARGNLSYVDREMGDVRVVEVILECIKMVDSLN